MQIGAEGLVVRGNRRSAWWPERSYLRRKRTAVSLSVRNHRPRRPARTSPVLGMPSRTPGNLGYRGPSGPSAITRLAEPLGLVAPVGEEPKDMRAVLLVSGRECELDLGPRDGKVHPLAMMLD
jgi:hypothetical protein